MSRHNRTTKINNIVNEIFLVNYFDGEFPKDKYDIELISTGLPLIRISNKKDPQGWMFYSNLAYYNIYQDIRLNIFRNHLAAYKIQQWWKPKFYDPKYGIIQRIMNSKYDEYNNTNS